MAEEKKPIIAIFGQRPLVSALFKQRERGPIVGVLLRMKPEARGTLIREFAIDTVTWVVGEGVGRILTRLIELNLAEFLGRAPRRGAS